MWTLEHDTEFDKAISPSIWDNYCKTPFSTPFVAELIHYEHNDTPTADKWRDLWDGSNFKSKISEHMKRIKFISCEIALWSVQQNGHLGW